MIGRLASLDAWPAWHAHWPARAAAVALRWESGLLLLLIAVSAVHFPSMHSYFHGDDFVALMDPASKPLLSHIASVLLFEDANFYWRPLGELYYLAVFRVFGLNPLVFHVASLAIFLATLALLFRLCLRLGLSPAAALGAACLLGLLPNHVVSVAWITNAPRLLATLFVLACLLNVESAARTGRARHEVVAWLFFVAAALSDETALSLAPVPPLLWALRSTGGTRVRSLLPRVAAYALPVLLLTPLQFMFTVDDEPRLVDYRLGPHVFTQLWALSSQLTLPLQSQSPLSEAFSAYSTVQWIAGALTVAAGVALFLAGSGLMRWLVLWTAAALAPFTLWDLDYTAPRYVYMAAVPFAIVVAWLAQAAWQLLPRPLIRRGALIAALPALVLLAGVSVQATLQRNQAWDRSSEPFRVLATGLKQALPEVRPNSRLLIYYGVWEGFPVWPQSVVRTIYGDETLDVVNVRRERADSDWPRRQSRDIVIFYAGQKFIAVPPAAQGLRTAP